VLALVTRNTAAGWLAAVCAAMIMLGNAKLFAWFARRRGWMFALATMPLRLLFYVVSAVGGGWAVATHVGQSPSATVPPLSPSPELRSRG
jgi:hypothetical protein